MRSASRAALGLAGVAWASALSASPERTQETIEDNVNAATGTTRKASDLVIVPIPQSNPSIGSGLAVAAALLYQPEGSPRPWVTGAAALYTSNGSKAIGAVQKAYLAGGKFRALGAVGFGDFNIDFYGVGGSAGARDEPIEINQKGWVVVLDGQVRVAPNLFAGAHYRMINLDTTLNLEDVPQFQTLGIPNPHLSATTSAIGPVVVYDSRDNEFAPRRGEFATIQYLQSSSALGSDFEYGKLVAEANIYRPLDENSVIAARVSMCSTGEDAPFFDICLFGSSNDLRGYPSGQYRDLGMFATQVEYRRRLGGRFGAVVFAGVGGVSDKFTNFDNYRILPAGGIGLRYSTSKDYGVNISVDFAWGKDSSGLYLYVAEAF